MSLDNPPRPPEVRMVLRQIAVRALATTALLMGAAATASAQYTSTLPDFDGNGSNGLVVVGMYTLVPSSGINFAMISGTFGNNSGATNTALEDIFLDGVLVASCSSQTDPCWNSPSITPWSFTLSPSDYSIFSDGQAVLSINQTGCCVIREGPTTLQVNAVATPEPASMTLIATGLVGVFGFARRKRNKRLQAA
jgi:PEP-CTERM motif